MLRHRVSVPWYERPSAVGDPVVADGPRRREQRPHCGSAMPCSRSKRRSARGRRRCARSAGLTAPRTGQGAARGRHRSDGAHARRRRPRHGVRTGGRGSAAPAVTVPRVVAVGDRRRMGGVTRCTVDAQRGFALCPCVEGSPPADSNSTPLRLRRPGSLGLERRTLASAGFRNHDDRPRGAFVRADAAALAVVQIDTEPEARAELAWRRQGSTRSSCRTEAAPQDMQRPASC